MMSIPVYFVDDEEDLRIAARQTLELADIAVNVFSDAAEVVDLVTPDFGGIVVSDIRMPGMDGVALMEALLRVDPSLPVILVTGHGDVDLAVQCLKAGAYDFIEKPHDTDRFLATVRRALDKRALTLENRTLRAQQVDHATVPSISGISDTARTLRAKVASLAGLDCDVLISGPGGAGKEVCARAIHANSARAAFPFVHVDCAALPHDLMELELFGHEAGAFPNANRMRFGKFEFARGGTVFLDGMAALDPSMQNKLLGAIEHRRIHRLGSNDAVALDVRFIGSIKSAEPVVDGNDASLGEDLFHRLAMATVHVPGLDRRLEDIPNLYAEFIDHFSRVHERPAPVVNGVFVTGLLARNWPGNIRQLRNHAERHVLGLEDIHVAPVDAGALTLADMTNAYERTVLTAALSVHKGNLKATYEALGVSRKVLYEKMQRHGLDRERFLAD